MCHNCNCDFFEKCSIVGYMPLGFCCENCTLYDEHHTCLESKSKFKEEKVSEHLKLREIKLNTASIEGNLLKVEIEHEKDKKKIIIIDLKKYLEYS